MNHVLFKPFIAGSFLSLPVTGLGVGTWPNLNQRENIRSMKERKKVRRIWEKNTFLLTGMG